MTEIKFRGKTVSAYEKTKWISGYFSRTGQGDPHILEHGKFLPYEVVPETVGQFSGFHDPNDVEIYEGDVVQREYDGFVKERLKRVRGVVTFGTGVIDVPVLGTSYTIKGWWIELLDGSGKIALEESDVVVGNIHDHPELLEVKK